MGRMISIMVPVRANTIIKIGMGEPIEFNKDGIAFVNGNELECLKRLHPNDLRDLDDGDEPPAKPEIAHESQGEDLPPELTGELPEEEEPEEPETEDELAEPKPEQQPKASAKAKKRAKRGK